MAHGLLQLEDEPRADRLEDRGGSAFLAVRGVLEVAVVAWSDVVHGAAAGHRRHPVGEEATLGDEHAGRAGAADELVRREKHRVEREVWLPRGGHLDLHVRSGRGVVPEGERAVRVQEPCDRADVGADARDVRGRRETADAERAVRVRDQFALEEREVDHAVGIFVDGHDVGDGFAPRELVGVVLVRADEHHGPLVRRDLRAQVIAGVEVRREAQVEDVDELVDRARRARAREDYAVLVGAADRAADRRARLLAEAARLHAGAARLGVRVRVERHHLATDEVLDERERASGRRVVRVRHAARAVGPVDDAVVADDRRADLVVEALRGRVVVARRVWLGRGGRRCVHGFSRGPRGCARRARRPP